MVPGDRRIIVDIRRQQLVSYHWSGLLLLCGWNVPFQTHRPESEEGGQHLGPGRLVPDVIILLAISIVAGHRTMNMLFALHQMHIRYKVRRLLFHLAN